jgi:hypothetical protein
MGPTMPSRSVRKVKRPTIGAMGVDQSQQPLQSSYLRDTSPILQPIEVLTLGSGLGV